MLPKHPKATLAFTALALLTLSACGGGENTASSASPSATASGTVSASASASAAASPEAASPSESVAYSGGSKAPAGEYRPADEHGPAQNVPKPKAPEGMNVETLEGLEKFITYWNDMRNYARETGDVTSMKKLVSEDLTDEQEYLDSLHEIYQEGGWLIGGKRTVHYQKENIFSVGDSRYLVYCNLERENMILWYGGEARVYDNSTDVYHGVEVTVDFVNGQWKVSNAREIH